MSARVSVHAAQRFSERLGCPSGSVSKLLVSLWHGGRDADAVDFVIFQARRLPGRRYRVVAHQRRDILLVRDAADGEFVTVIKL